MASVYSAVHDVCYRQNAASHDQRLRAEIVDIIIVQKCGKGGYPMFSQDAQISDLLTNIHSIAAVGVSSHPTSPGYEVLSYQQSQGYSVIPVNPNEASVLGQPCVPTVSAAKAPVDLVNVFVAGPPLDEAVDTAIAHHAKAIWFQPGVEDGSAEQRARSAGLQVVKDRCFQREHRRLMADKPF